MRTTISALFLLAIAIMNFSILRETYRSLRKIKQGEYYQEQRGDACSDQGGFLVRLFRPFFTLINRSWKMYPLGMLFGVRLFQPFFTLINRSWKMYPLGMLFGLGFNTATEVTILSTSAALATKGLPVWSLLLFPALFTVGICLLDTMDGIVMLGAYGWALVKPIRKIHYNFTMTLLSALLALTIGLIEVFSLIKEQLDLNGGIWNVLDTLRDHFTLVGVAMAGVFILCWIASTVIYKFK